MDCGEVDNSSSKSSDPWNALAVALQAINPEQVGKGEDNQWHCPPCGPEWNSEPEGVNYTQKGGKASGKGANQSGGKGA